MNFLFYLLIFIVQLFKNVEGQCSDEFWNIQNASIGSINISWRHNIVSKSIQFLIEGQINSNIDITSTYISIGWFNELNSTNYTDMAIFFLTTQTIQDRYKQEKNASAIDKQQDFCLIQMNLMENNVSIVFERLIETDDINDHSFQSNVYLIFSMGSYSLNNNTNSFDLDSYFIDKSYEKIVNFINCSTIDCLKDNYSQETCSCFTPSTTNVPVLAVINGSCENQERSCSFNGLCIQTAFDQFICQCNAGYTGVRCQTSLFSSDMNILKNCKCQNEGVCLNDGTCSCSDRYRGEFCQLVNPCNDYCYENGLCTVECTNTTCSKPNCTCISGYTGEYCNETIDSACKSNPCLNGNCIVKSSDNFKCECFDGYTGVRCDMINSCLSNPCNQGTCITSTNCNHHICDYICLCPIETTGRNCEISAKSCKDNPCLCSPLFNGTNCDSIFNVCKSDSCLNNGSCIQNLTNQNEPYKCQCSNEFIGKKCEYVNTCYSSPCQNGARCISLTDNCTSSFCPFKCLCSSETIGERCEVIRERCTNTTCLNNGTCHLNETSTYSKTYCQCSEDYTGQYCETRISNRNSCLQNPCGSNAICIDFSNSSYYCICPNGFVGKTCDSIDFEGILGTCTNSSCRYLSTCQQVENKNSSSYKCICPEYLTGDRCQYTNNCQRRPCLNQGRCIPLGPQNNFMCDCLPGFGHYDCSIYTGTSCQKNVCLNGGTCNHQKNTNVQCLCPENFAGPRCEWQSVCSINTCQNGGTCRQIAPTIAECLCPIGFSGPTCSLYDSCSKFPCQNGGGCTTLLVGTDTNWSAYRCICPPGYYGQNCDTKINSCANMSCPTYKICVEQPTGPVCVCSGNKIGQFCQYENPCNSSSFSCQNGGTCILPNPETPTSSCLCSPDYTGRFCEQLIESDPCLSNPCQARGHCQSFSSNRTYQCICRENFIGDRCQQINPCVSKPCFNHGICQAHWNQADSWFTCICLGTYTGTQCELSMLNPCGGLCMHGSPCIHGVCVCPAQYTGTFCGFENPCYYPTCQNNGVCSVVSNATDVSFMCTCPNSYTGQYCEMFLNTNESIECSSDCMNNGSCVNGKCVCTSESIGKYCEHENPCLKQNPCVNGGNCYGHYDTNQNISIKCVCPAGFTGEYCDAIICSSTACNGGVCTATQNGIACACPKGKFGNRCEYADACAQHPCLENERCEQKGSFYECISCYDKVSYCSIYQFRNEYCDNRYTILVNDTFLPVPQVCQRSCGQCIPVQHLKDISTLFDNETSNVNNITQINKISTIMTNDYLQEKCIDKRNDCFMQKAYGFCQILNERYPTDCVKTCHPDCESLN